MLCTTMYAVIHCLTHSYDLNQTTYYIAALTETTTTTKKKGWGGARGKREGRRKNPLNGIKGNVSRVLTYRANFCFTLAKFAKICLMKKNFPQKFYCFHSV